MFYRTMKEVPKEASIISHQLMFRAGMIQQLTSGIYNYLPLALKSLKKIEAIIRDVLNEYGCQEVLLPMVQPAELWKESGRWDYYGDELLRLRDRKDNEYCLGPTHEEVITDLVRRNLKSYKQLPWNLFQIQTKFRDEVRPRFGLMRGREFLMKDAYSFDRDTRSSEKTYYRMYEAYREIFTRVGVEFKAVEALTGNIGGSLSHEFQVLADSGEDLVISCGSCDYAANSEKAEAKRSPAAPDEKLFLELKEVATPGARTIDEVSVFLGKSGYDFIKSLVYQADGMPVLILIRGDRDLNEEKVRAFLGAGILEMADDQTVLDLCGAEPGYVGPVGLSGKVKILCDYSLEGRENLVCGANRKDYHLVNVNWMRDFSADFTGDFGFALAGDACPRCGSPMGEYRGIEVGQVFSLGTKYSSSMNCSYLDEEGKERPAVMGCYGIGVSRTLAAVIEQNHDEAGIIWPVPVAPFEVIVLPLQMNSDEVVVKAEEIYGELVMRGVDATLDDRQERAGFKFNDADLVGYPLQICLGSKSLEKGVAEVKNRRTGEKQEIPLEGIYTFVADFLGREKVK